MTIRLDGLQSGMDTTALIKSMIDAERLPFVRKQNEIYVNEDKIYAWSKIDTNVTTLNGKAVKLNTYSVWQQKKASTPEDDGVLTSTATKDAANGTYNVSVANIAQEHRISSDDQGSTSTALGFSGDFTVGDQSVTVETTDTLSDIRDKINDAATSMDAEKKVNATIIGNTLVLERDKTGATEIEISEATGNTVLRDLGILTATESPAGTFQEVKNQLQEPKDLAATINGVAVTSTENTGIDTFMDGVTLNFKTAGDTTLTIESDKDTIKDLIKEFITAYNDAMSVAEDASAVNLDKATTGEDGAVESLGLLQGDFLLSEIKSRTRRIMTTMDTNPQHMDQDYNTLQKIGIWTSGKENRLSIVDEEALDDALENHWDEVEDLFRDYDSGIMRKMVEYTDALISPLEGQVVNRRTNLEKQNTTLQRQIDDFDARVPDIENEYYERFAKMETQLAEIQGQSGYVLSSLGIKQG